MSILSGVSAWNMTGGPLDLFLKILSCAGIINAICTYTMSLLDLTFVQNYLSDKASLNFENWNDPDDDAEGQPGNELPNMLPNAGQNVTVNVGSVNVRR